MEKTLEKKAPCNLRACSYNPAQNMIKVSYDDGTECDYLNVQYRKLWFNTYLSDQKLSGYIDVLPAEFISTAPNGIGFFAARSIIYIEGQIAGTDNGYCEVDSMHSFDMAAATACTRAAGRALANAGFGTVNVDRKEDGDPYPVDSGVPVISPDIQCPDQEPETELPFYDSSKESDAELPPEPIRSDAPNRSSRTVGTRAGTQPGKRTTQRRTAAAESAAPAPRKSQSAAGLDYSKMTVEEAKQVFCEVNNANKTLGELMLDNAGRGLVEWCAWSPKFENRHKEKQELRHAARLLIPECPEKYAKS